MKKILNLVILFILALGVIYFLFGRNLNWKINRSDVVSASINGRALSNTEIDKIVETYNNMYSISKRNSMNGSTATYIVQILLKSGEEITIDDGGGMKGYIVGKKKEGKYNDYWAKSKDFYDICQEILPIRTNNVP